MLAALAVEQRLKLIKAQPPDSRSKMILDNLNGSAQLDLQPPEYQLSPANARDIDDVDAAQNDSRRNGIVRDEGEGDDNGSRSPTTINTREEDEGFLALKGRSPDEPFVIGEDGSDDDSEANSEDETPLRTSLLDRVGGLRSWRDPLQADNSAQCAPEAALPESNDPNSLLEGNFLLTNYLFLLKLHQARARVMIKTRRR
ncbi:hypothetical protein FKW77_010875 [Venturia effusa]|uniref:Uncharacterized protein n=1 Tax=Venturia effusa TaxID=50376 RepID=A0A517KYP5_9PEZI|nr:hypothetical protein FKW77_010875 [Venturia effusa]